MPLSRITSEDSKLENYNLNLQYVMSINMALANIITDSIDNKNAPFDAVTFQIFRFPFIESDISSA